MTELENEGDDAGNRADDAPGVGAAVALSALALAACGGGGGSSTPPPVQNPGPTPPVPSPPPPPPPPPPPVQITDAEAARFLLQAQFAVTDADLAAVKSNGYPAWLTSSYSQPLGQTGVAWLDSRGHNSITSEQRYFWPQFGDFMIWNQLLAGPDQMRKRLAFALSEFFVVSLSPIDGFYPPYVIGAYWDVLTANVYGNFRELLERITLNAGMGFFLNTKGNLKEDANGRQPDENYAREVMQLFTIGLYELNPDGTPRLDANNNPIETYGQSDITNLARVFTGYDWDPTGNVNTVVSWHPYPVPNTRFATNPMRFIPNNHSNLAVSFLGTNIPANTPGPEALRIALDRLFSHANTGPFFARQMIQRLVTSNPSPAYVGRVAAAFANNGAGVRGDLKAVWTAILNDPDARTLPAAAETLSGKLREPVVRLVQWARTVGITSTNGAYEIYDLSGSDTLLGQSPLRSPSVFNFFRPGYVPPNTAIAAAGKQAPEFQLLNESSTAGYINFMQGMTRNGYFNFDVNPTYAALLPIAHDVPAVLAWLNLRLTANQLSAETLTLVQAVMTAFNLTAATAENTKLDMLATACFLILCSPEYLVQK